MEGRIIVSSTSHCLYVTGQTNHSVSVGLRFQILDLLPSSIQFSSQQRIFCSSMTMLLPSTSSAHCPLFSWFFNRAFRYFDVFSCFPESHCTHLSLFKRKKLSFLHFEPTLSHYLCILYDIFPSLLGYISTYVTGDAQIKHLIYSADKIFLPLLLLLSLLHCLFRPLFCC